MKVLVLLVCILARTLRGQSQQPSDPPVVPNQQYFPAGVFETSTHSFTDNWYSCTLRALQEPSLLALRSDPSHQVYPFLSLHPRRIFKLRHYQLRPSLGLYLRGAYNQRSERNREKRPSVRAAV